MMRGLCALALVAALGGCAAFDASGDRARGFADPKIADAYIPLHGTAYLVLEGDAAAVVIAPGVAVTNAHNANLLDAKAIIGTSVNYDLLFFHTERGTAMTSGQPRPGEHVLAYGQGGKNELRVAHGVVRVLNAPVEPNCKTCIVQAAFTFEGNAGKGFSGGPVVDASDGHLVGIVFGYVDGAHGARLMYAYDMKRVQTELAAVEGKLPTDVD
jgi:hypothetical protein